MTLRQIISIITLAAPILCFGQDFAKIAQRNFAKRATSEKVYIHTDKPDYMPGDTIWFKGYLVDAIGNSVKGAQSNFIYIEIFDKLDTLMVAKTIKRDSTGVFKGYMELGKEFTVGEYTIRSYTQWMRNFPKEYFFFRDFSIIEPFARNGRMRVETKNEDSILILNLHLGGAEMANKKVECLIQNLTTNKQFKVNNQTSNSNGVVTLPTKGINGGDKVVMQVTTEMKGQKTKTSLKIEIPRSKYSVSLLPEGGDLIEGEARRVAFKALSANGTPIKINGYIANEHGDTIALMSTQRDGMGTFILDATADTKYTAYTKSEDGIEMQTAMPEVKKDGVALLVQTDADKVYYGIQKVGAYKDKPLYAVIHTRGVIKYIMPLTKSVFRQLIPTEELTEGISHIVITDESGMPLAERLIFVAPKEVDIAIKNDKEHYAERELMELEFSLPEKIDGNFSVSVTDDSFVKQTEMADNIVSNLLLSSDLHGVIEKPYSYIYSPDVDLVMLTNGWRRFNVQQIITSQEQELPHYLEKGQVITGQVQSGYKKNLLEAKVFAQIVSTDSTRLSMVDKNGRFEIGDLDIAGNKRVTLKSIHPQNKALDARFNIDTIPAKEAPFAKRRLNLDSFERYSEDTAKAPTAEIPEADKDSYKTIQIDAAVITSRKRTFKNVYNPDDEIVPNRLSPKMAFYASPFNKYLNYINPNLTLKELIQSTGWVNYSADYFDKKEKRIAYYSTILFVIDGIRFKIEYSDDLSSWNYLGEQITAIERIEGARVAGYGVNPEYGISMDKNYSPQVIIIETKYSNNSLYYKQISPDIAVVDFVGYDKCEAEFYSPKYTTKERGEHEADYRSTLYWNPNVEIKAQQPVKLRFYSSDNTTGSYTVTVCGVANDNRPVHKTRSITLNP